MNNPVAFPTTIIPCRICGKGFEAKSWNISSRDYRCPLCKREAQNNSNAANPDKLREKGKRRYIANKDYWKKYSDARKNDPFYILKRRARGFVSTGIADGSIIKPSVCERCRLISDRLEAHHADYNKPLDIEWLCKRCHCRADKEIAAAMLAEREKHITR